MQTQKNEITDEDYSFYSDAHKEASRMPTRKLLAFGRAHGRSGSPIARSAKTSNVYSTWRNSQSRRAKENARRPLKNLNPTFRVYRSNLAWTAQPLFVGIWMRMVLWTKKTIVSSAASLFHMKTNFND